MTRPEYISERPDFHKWASNIAQRAAFGEGYAYNLPDDLREALEDAYRLGGIDGGRK